MTRVPWVSTGRRNVNAAISRRAATRKSAMGKWTAAGCIAPNHLNVRRDIGRGPASTVAAWSIPGVMASDPCIAAMSEPGEAFAAAAVRAGAATFLSWSSWAKAGWMNASDITKASHIGRNLRSPMLSPIPVPPVLYALAPGNPRPANRKTDPCPR